MRCAHHLHVDGFIRLQADDQLISERVQVGGQLSRGWSELNADLHLALIQGLACLQDERYSIPSIGTKGLSLTSLMYCLPSLGKGTGTRHYIYFVIDNTAALTSWMLVPVLVFTSQCKIYAHLGRNACILEAHLSQMRKVLTLACQNQNRYRHPACSHPRQAFLIILG